MFAAIILLWIVTYLNAPTWIIALAWIKFIVDSLRCLGAIYEAGKESNELK